MKPTREKAEYFFKCFSCEGNITTQELEGACPHCGVLFKIEWQAVYNRKPYPPAKVVRTSSEE